MFAFHIFAIALGLVLGSFLLTVAMRLQDGRSLLVRSHCESCSTNISVTGLIPVIGYLVQKGKCTHCGEKISAVYPLVELINAAIIWSIFSKTGIEAAFLHKLILFELFLLIAIIDFRTHLIFPQPVVIGLLVQTFWLLTFENPGLLNSIIGLFLGAGIFHWVSYLYFLVRKKEGLGSGDATLLGLIGFVLGWKALFGVIFLASILGIVGGSIILLINRQSISKEIAFGPWLSLSAFFIWRFSEQIQGLPLWFSGIDLSYF